MARKKTAGNKPQTLNEFKAWLSGILAFQPSDWCPTADQWNNIYDTIMALKDETVEVVREVPVPVPQATTQAPNASSAPTLAGAAPAPLLSSPPQTRTGGGHRITLLPEGDDTPAVLDIPQIDPTVPDMVNVSSTVKLTNAEPMRLVRNTEGGYKSPFGS